MPRSLVSQAGSLTTGCVLVVDATFLKRSLIIAIPYHKRFDPILDGVDRPTIYQLILLYTIVVVVGFLYGVSLFHFGKSSCIIFLKRHNMLEY